MDELKTRYVNQTVGIAYHYFNYASDDTGTGTARQVIASLCKQIMTTTGVIPSEIYQLYASLYPKRESPSLADLTKLLILVSKLSELNFIIIDALDNCPDVRPYSELERLLDILGQLSISFKICATARPESMRIKNFFSGSPRIEIVANVQEVRRYLDAVAKTIDYIESEETQMIVDKLVVSSQGL